MILSLLTQKTSIEEKCMNNKKLLIIIILVIFFNSNIVYANALSEKYEEKIDQIANDYIGKTVPGACVIISEHGKTVFSKCYGYSDLEKKTGIDENNTYFEWGSITKTLVWVSVIQLEEKGLIDIEADIRQYLPKDFLKNLKYEQEITMLDLMNHTAGFEEFLIDFRYADNEAEIPLSEVLSVYQPKQIFKPKIASGYSNWGAALAAYIVENISGMPFDEYVKQNIFKPLSIEKLEIEPILDDSVLQKKARGYSYSGGKFKREDYMSIKIYPAGSLNGTPNALMKYANELAKDNSLRSLLFANAQTKDNLFTETWRSCKSKSGLAHGFWEYIGNNKIFGHEGGTYGFKTQLWVEPDKERVILIATNVMETNFCSDVMSSIIKNENISNIKSKSNNDLKIFTGDYLPARGVYSNVGKIITFMQAVRIKPNNDKEEILLEKVFDGKEYIYIPIGENIFYCETTIPEERYLSFSIESGKVSAMTFKLAHDYIPVSGIKSINFIILIISIFFAAFLFWLVECLISIVFIYKKKTKFLSAKMLGIISSLLLGITEIIGFSIWMNMYTVNAFQLNTIVLINLALLISAVYSFTKLFFKSGEKIKASIFLIVISLQIFSIYYLGFFNMV